MALWDVNTSQPVTEYEAHEKRIWSVDFCHTDPMLFLSGSDDGWVKVCLNAFAHDLYISPNIVTAHVDLMLARDFAVLSQTRVHATAVCQ